MSDDEQALSDDEQALSDDDGADLFESESDSEVGQSFEMPSLDSLQLRSPLQTGRDDGVVYESTGCETDQSGVGEFEIDDVASSPARVESEREEHANRDDMDSPENDEGEDPGLDEQRPSKGGDELQSEERVAMSNSSTTIAKCERPKLPELGGRRDESSDEKQLEHHKPGDELNIVLDNGCDRSSDFQCDKLRLPSSMENTIEVSDLGLVSTSAGEDKTSRHAELVSLSTKSEILTEKQTQANPTQDETTSEENKLSPHECEKQQTDIKPSPSGSLKNTVKEPVYTVESLFPVIYESYASAPSEIAKVVPISSVSRKAQTSNRRRRSQIDGNNSAKSVASRLAALQAQLDAAHSELTNATRTFKLQLSMVETDNKKLAQRNARLKNQLSLATADLQRSNAEMAKLKTENELYAAKLPRLQAELLEETSQVDETQALSVQTQLVLTQLKARSHVLQTRNLSLEAQNTKLTQQLRECQQQLKHKTAALQQHIEKVSKLEADMNELKITNTQEKLDWKNRLATALQRFEHDKTKLETQLKSSARKDLREMKDRAEKAVQKRRTAEATAAKLEEQLKHCNHELSSANDAVRRNVNETRNLESLLRKAHRTEATLRNDLAACKAKLRTLQGEKKRRMARLAPAQTRRRRLEQQIPIELFLHLTDSSDDDDEDEDNNQETQWCSHCLPSTKAIEPQSPPPSVCSKCPRLQDQLHQLQQELRRVRSLHSVELHAQASVLDALLQSPKRQLALVTPI